MTFLRPICCPDRPCCSAHTLQLPPGAASLPLPLSWLQRHYYSDGGPHQQPPAPGVGVGSGAALPATLTVTLHVLTLDGSGRRQLACSALFRGVALRQQAGEGPVPAADGWICGGDQPWELHHPGLIKEVQVCCVGVVWVCVCAHVCVGYACMRTFVCLCVCACGRGVELPRVREELRASQP